MLTLSETKHNKKPQNPPHSNITIFLLISPQSKL